MKKQEAIKAAKLIKIQLNKLKNSYRFKDLKENFMFTIKVQESDSSKDWFGVHIYTDAEAYDAFYDSWRNQELIQKAVNKQLKAKEDDHYFERDGGGILTFY